LIIKIITAQPTRWLLAIVIYIHIFIGSMLMLGGAWNAITHLDARGIPYHFIPNESFLFSFNPTVTDSGSGEYWVYGEDSRNYYYFILDNYLLMPKKNKCNNADPADYRTWCEAKEVCRRVPYYNTTIESACFNIVEGTK
jgi:hypothetical protein